MNIISSSESSTAVSASGRHTVKRHDQVRLRYIPYISKLDMFYEPEEFLNVAALVALQIRFEKMLKGGKKAI